MPWIIGGLVLFGLFVAWPSSKPAAKTLPPKGGGAPFPTGGGIVPPPAGDVNADQIAALSFYAPFIGWASYQHEMPGIWQFSPGLPADLSGALPAYDPNADSTVPALELLRFAHDSGFDVWIDDNNSGTGLVFIIRPSDAAGVAPSNARALIRSGEPWPLQA